MELLKELEEMMGISQLPQAVETMASRKEILAALGGYTLSAVLGGILAFLALRFIARRNGKGNLFTRECLTGGSPETKRPEGWDGDGVYDSGESSWQRYRAGEAYGTDQEKENRKRTDGTGELFTPSLAAGAAIGVLYMLAINFI